MKLNEFVRYAEDLVDFQLSNKCSVCGLEINETNMIWLGDGSYGRHDSCGAIYEFLPEIEVFLYIGRSLTF